MASRHVELSGPSAFCWKLNVNGTNILAVKDTMYTGMNDICMCKSYHVMVAFTFIPVYIVSFTATIQIFSGSKSINSHMRSIVG